MVASLKIPSKQGVSLFFLWYRLITLVFVAFLALSGMHPSPLWLLGLAGLYNILVFRYRTAVLGKLKKYPCLIAVDLLVVSALVYESGVLKTPYYLYSFSPLFFGSFFFGYFWAVILASAQSTLYFGAKYFGNQDFSIYGFYSEHITSYIFFYFLIAVSTAYLADLLDKLEVAHEKRAVVNCELDIAKKRLQQFLIDSKLSERESQVLKLLFEGYSVEQISTELNIAKDTAKTYVKRTYGKLGVATRQAAISKVMSKEC